MKKVPLLLLAAGCLSAVPIPIVNFSFEDPVQILGSFNFGPITGWTNVGISGVFRPNSMEFNLPLPDGVQTGYSNGGAISQALSALQNSTKYTLQVDVGKRLDCCTAFGPVVQLFAGSTLIATAPAVNPGLGNFLTATAMYTSLASDPLAGLALKIVLDSSGTQTDFDNVRLDATAAAGPGPVPEPSAAGLLGLGLGVLFLVRKRLAL